MPLKNLKTIIIYLYKITKDDTLFQFDLFKKKCAPPQTTCWLKENLMIFIKKNFFNLKY